MVHNENILLGVRPRKRLNSNVIQINIIPVHTYTINRKIYKWVHAKICLYLPYNDIGSDRY